MDPPIPETAVAVIATCDRPGGVSYLDATADALHAEGASTCGLRVVFVDGLDSWNRDPPAGWHIYGHRKRLGVRAVLWSAFRLALESGAEQLLYFEDDVIPCRAAVHRMLSVAIPPDCAFVDFHDMGALSAKQPHGLTLAQPYGDRRYGYTGNQAMLFPRRTLEWLVALRDPSEDGCNGGDILIGDMILASPWPRYVVHVPCLVRHVGAVSAAHPGEQLRSSRLPSNYPGDDFDASALQFAHLKHPFRSQFKRPQLPSAPAEALRLLWPVVDRGWLWHHYARFAYREEPDRSRDAIASALAQS